MLVHIFEITVIPVAPLAGAWIEMQESAMNRSGGGVAPLAGAWIEMPRLVSKAATKTSPPSRGRGLK